MGYIVSKKTFIILVFVFIGCLKNQVINSSYLSGTGARFDLNIWQIEDSFFEPVFYTIDQENQVDSGHILVPGDDIENFLRNNAIARNPYSCHRSTIEGDDDSSLIRREDGRIDSCWSPGMLENRGHSLIFGNDGQGRMIFEGRGEQGVILLYQIVNEHGELLPINIEELNSAQEAVERAQEIIGRI